tara:strand:- start:39 stop:143 length:105 start_codon:yes stop_codon:yes gene_type:complete
VECGRSRQKQEPGGRHREAEGRHLLPEESHQESE